MYSSSVIGSQPAPLPDTTDVPEVSARPELAVKSVPVESGDCVNASVEGGIGAATDSGVVPVE